MRSTLCCLALLICGSAVRAQTPDTLLAGADLQADIDLLAEAYGSLHPGLYRHQTPEAWASRVATLRADVSGGMSQRAFYVRVAELLAAIQCGHSYPNFFNQSAAVQARVLAAGRRLPFRFRWIDGEMVVTRDLSGRGPQGGGLPPGTRVRALDGVPTAEILARLMPLARADGGNDAKRRENLAVSGGEPFEAFDVYYPLVFALGDTVAVDVAGPLRAAARTLRLATQTHAEREALRTSEGSAPGANPLGWTLRTLADGTAVLRMPGWATYQTDWDWQAFLDSTVARLIQDDVPRFVVDLRDNEGGSDVGDVILSALTPRDLTFASGERYVRYRALPPALRPYADTWDRSFDDWTSGVDPAATGDLLRMTRYDDGAASKTIRPGPRLYTGRVAVLVSAVNSSATFGFAQDVKQSGLALLVGQTTGGNQRGINGGAFYFFRLPRSGIEVDVPLVGFYPPGRRVENVHDGGIQPDIEVPLTADDLARDGDRILDAAVAALSR